MTSIRTIMPSIEATDPRLPEIVHRLTSGQSSLLDESRAPQLPATVARVQYRDGSEDSVSVWLLALIQKAGPSRLASTYTKPASVWAEAVA